MAFYFVYGKLSQRSSGQFTNWHKTGCLSLVAPL